MVMLPLPRFSLIQNDHKLSLCCLAVQHVQLPAMFEDFVVEGNDQSAILAQFALWN